MSTERLFVTSDPHGCYDKYQELIKKINLGEKDKLIILGDVLDRGPKPISIIKDIM